MEKDLVIILAENDADHASLITKNIRKAGFENEVLHFRSGKEILDFLFRRGDGLHRLKNTPYLLILGNSEIESKKVIKEIKQDFKLKVVPIIIITSTDDPDETEKYYELGCNIYLTKPVDYDKFIDLVNKLGLFLTIVKVPKVSYEA